MRLVFTRPSKPAYVWMTYQFFVMHHPQAFDELPLNSSTLFSAGLDEFADQP
jgi:hypothetical protein